MTDSQSPEDPPISARDSNGDRVLGAVTYGLMLVGFTNGLTVLIAVILAYIRRDQADALMLNHLRYQIHTFWYWLALSVLGVLTIWVLGLGLLILLAANIWLVVRAAVGLIRLVDGRPHPDPTGFWI